MGHPRTKTGIATLVSALLIVGWCANAGGQSIPGTVEITGGKARFAAKKSGDAAHSLKLTLRLGPKYLSDFHDPETQPLRAVLGESVLVDAEPGAAGFKKARGSRWRYSGEAAGGRVRISANGNNGKLKVKLSRASLPDLRASDAEDVPFVLDIAGIRVETEASFRVKDGRVRRWRGLRTLFLPFPGPGPKPNPGPDPDPGAGPVSFRSLAKGLDSMVLPKQHQIARNQSEWAALWSRHQPGGTPPTVDFSQDMVIGTFLGMPLKQNQAGMTSTIRVVSITDIGSRREVVVEETANGAPWSCPPPGLGAPCILPDPYHFVTAPRTSLPVTFVVQ